MHRDASRGPGSGPSSRCATARSAASLRGDPVASDRPDRHFDRRRCRSRAACANLSASVRRSLRCCGCLACSVWRACWDAAQHPNDAYRMLARSAGNRSQQGLPDETGPGLAPARARWSRPQWRRGRHLLTSVIAWRFSRFSVERRPRRSCGASARCSSG